MKPWVTRKEDRITREVYYSFHVPAKFMEEDWRFTLLMEFALMLAKPEDFIKDKQ